MNKTYTCIICPNGCDIHTVIEKGHIVSLEGALCPRGKEYVAQELYDPLRNIASSVKVQSGELPLVSVRLSAPIPKKYIFDVMKEIRGLQVSAPVKLGDILAADVLGLGCNIIATKHVGKAAEPQNRCTEKAEYKGG